MSNESDARLNNTPTKPHETMTRINLDYSAGTPMWPEVRQAMDAAFGASGNPSSIHQAGRQARQALEQARRQVAGLLGASPPEIFFTSCATEANNWALRGLMAGHRRKGNHLVVSAIEHPSILSVAKRLGLDGMEMTLLAVDGEGCVLPAALKAVLTPQTVLVSVMLANGEIGTIEPVQELAAVAHEHGALFHTDATAAVGHLPVDVRALGVDALSCAATQWYGPPGVGALFVREGLRILPLLEGGGQEGGGRSGTEGLPTIIGMGVAAQLAAGRLTSWILQIAGLRDRLRDELVARIPRVQLTGSWTSRLAQNLHLCFEGLSSESLVLGLDQAGIAAGLGSACNSKAMRPSHVLKAIGLTDDEASGALVLTLGAMTTEEEIQHASEHIPRVVEKLRRVTALTARPSVVREGSPSR